MAHETSTESVARPAADDTRRSSAPREQNNQAIFVLLCLQAWLPRVRERPHASPAAVVAAAPRDGSVAHYFCCWRPVWAAVERGEWLRPDAPRVLRHSGQRASPRDFAVRRFGRSRTQAGRRPESKPIGCVLLR